MHYYFDYSEPLFRPPSEAHSLIFQITHGCSQNNCTFCGMYRTKEFQIRPVPEIVAEMEKIPQSQRLGVQRIFLADGDALVYPQSGLVEILDLLAEHFPNITRVAAYASPNSLTTKSCSELEVLHKKKLRVLYFGLESGDDETLKLIKKGFERQQMLELCLKAQGAGIKLSITAILGLAGRKRTLEHALATADWVNQLSPAYFSLLTMFRRHNDAHFCLIEQLSNGEVLQEALAVVRDLAPQKTILRSNHVSNSLNLAGSYPKDREKLILQAEACLAKGHRNPAWYHQVPAYKETIF